jgi:hypothetical protein
MPMSTAGQYEAAHGGIRFPAPRCSVCRAEGGWLTWSALLQSWRCRAHVSAFHGQRREGRSKA